MTTPFDEYLPDLTPLHPLLVALSTHTVDTRYGGQDHAEIATQTATSDDPIRSLVMGQALAAGEMRRAGRDGAMMPIDPARMEP